MTGDSPPALRGARYSKYVDQAAVFEGAGVACAKVDSPATAVADVKAICERAKEGVTIVTTFPELVLDDDAGDELSALALPAAPVPAGPPDPAEIEAVAELLSEGWAFRRPVILAGRGAVESGALEDLKALAEASGALVGTTLLARSFFDGDPFNIGIIGSYSNANAVELLAEADLVLAFGSSLDMFTTLKGALFPQARVICFDRDAGKPSASVTPDMWIQTDARLAASALVEALRERGHQPTTWRNEDTKEKLATPVSSGTIEPHTGTGLDPRALMQRLDQVLPADRAVVIDQGHHFFFGAEYLSVQSPDAYFIPFEFMCLGAATGIALGVAAARPDRLTVLEIGDGGMMMTLGDLDTAARYNLPVLALVVNDGALGAELQLLERFGWPSELVRSSTPSFEAVGVALGLEGITVDTIEKLDELGERVAALKGPMVADCLIAPEVQADGFALANDFSGLSWDPPEQRVGAEVTTG
jgi:thiamine pyrophosphate-dependent acetolactate synthase large subunit-like protein